MLHLVFLFESLLRTMGCSCNSDHMTISDNGLVIQFIQTATEHAKQVTYSMVGSGHPLSVLYWKIQLFELGSQSFFSIGFSIILCLWLEVV